MSPPWTVGAVTLAHVAAPDFARLPAALREPLAALFWGDVVMAAFPGDHAWQVATSVLTDIAWWLAAVPRLPARAVIAALPAYLPEAARVTAAEPPPPAAPCPVIPPAPEQEPQPSFWLARTGWPQCPHGPLRLVPAGISARTGRPYASFWGCSAWPFSCCNTRAADLPPASIPAWR